jgi:hypothetical protein
MHSRFETLITATEIDAAFARMYEPAPVQGNEQPPQLQTSLLELNGVLLVVMGGIAAILMAAVFLLSVH